MNTKRILLWMGLGLAAGCYAGVETEGDEDFDRTRGACLFAGSDGSSSTYAWNCNHSANSAAVGVDGVLVAAPAAAAAGPVEDAILQNAGDMLGGVVADCMQDPEFATNCTNECGAMGLSWEPPGVCQEEMDVMVQIVGPIDDDPEGGVCPDGQPRKGAVVEAIAPCMCQCGAPLQGPPPPPGGQNNHPLPPPPN